MSESKFKAWYLENRERLSEDRCQRYEQDPVYREKQKRWSKEYRERKKKRKKKRKKVIDRHRSCSLFSCKLGDDVVTCWSVGYLAERLGLSRPRVGQWERCAVIPGTPISRQGIRYYTTEQIEAVEEVADLYGLPGSGDPLIYYEILGRWDELNIGDLKKAEEILPVVDIDGVRLYEARYLVERVDRSLGALFAWENKGILPVTPFWFGGWQFYTEPMMDAVVEAVEERHGIVRAGEGIYAEIEEAWQEEIEVVEELPTFTRY
jgi:hypothetical protein